MNRWHSLPAELYALVEHTPATVLLESAEPAGANRAAAGAHALVDPQQASRSGPSHVSYSRLFTAPLRVCVANQSAELPNLFAEIEIAVAAGHYAAGFFAYECGQFFEPTAAMQPNRSGQPLAWFGIYAQCHIFDHRIGAFLDGDPHGLAQFRAHADHPQPPTEPQLETTLAITEEQYAERIAAIHGWIRSGDVYQLNFTVPIQVHSADSPAALYSLLRARQPVPYGAFLHTQPSRHILSFSPELFFRLDHLQSEEHGPTRRITTRPMKGTAPRGRTTREDRDLAEWLRNDPKNRSENVMIVDLLRNDLGRLCNYGSVRAESLFAVERYPTLWQMTSTITGELRPEVNFQQIFRALFPCGSVTGAPKVRAMQLLAKLEQQLRGVYTGAIGFFSKDQSIFNVAIRTLELEGDHGTMGVGSGIVIDSDAAGEFRECLLKAEFLTHPSSRFPDSASDSFSLVETMLWNGGFPLIELHLDRLEDSAFYFGFPCDRTAVKAALLAHAATFTVMLGAPGLASETWETTDLNPPNSPTPSNPQMQCAPSIPHLSAEWVRNHVSQSIGISRKVRLLLERDGNLKIESEILPDSSIASPARVCIAPQRTDPRDPMLFHKTTHRPLYAEAFKAATQAGFDDVLFLNIRDEVTEGAISNVFVEMNGRLFTPPVECGLLAGVQRRHLLETRPEIEERVLYLEDLRHADAIYLSNAVRGLRPAIIAYAFATSTSVE
jgi:para-aminobenzoate synthetase/4-amino-4-deoxychorismate lyase